MQLHIGILCIYNVLTVNGFEVLRINDGYKGLVDKIESISIESRVEIPEQWIEQKLDHFNKSDSRTWKMRYYENSEFWKTKGPIYLFINGEASASTRFLSTGTLYELAKETNGTMYVSEHRYYGKSQPINRTHFNVDDMKYLTVAQALADNKQLVKTIKNNPLYKNSKLVIVGGSYAGNLAAWMDSSANREIKDTVVISSSAPVLAKRDFYEYLEVVSNDYEKYGSAKCLEKIKNIFERYDTLCKTEEGIKELKKEENICDETDMTKPENRQLFFLAKTSLFMYKSQYGTVKDIRKHCSELMMTQNVQSDIKYYWNGFLACFDYDFDKMVQEYYETKNNDNLCWTYQTCTEFGYFQSTTSDKQPFTKNIPVEWYDKFCTALFGAGFDKDRVNKGVNKTNEVYGGKNPDVYNTVFANGELDPWSALGITENMDRNYVIYIPKSSHCKDLFSNSEDDEEELKLARAKIKRQVKQYLNIGDDVSPES